MPGQGEGSSGPTNPSIQIAELAGGEAFGMVGMRYFPSKTIALCMGIVYDNNNAILLRPGVTVNF
jgi:hypothetical protein